MEPSLRGMVEKWIDKCLENDRLIQYYKTAKYYRDNGIIESVESAMFGIIYESVMCMIIDYHKKPLTKEKANELNKIMDSRAMEIKSRIREIAYR